MRSILGVAFRRLACSVSARATLVVGAASTVTTAATVCEPSSWQMVQADDGSWEWRQKVLAAGASLSSAEPIVYDPVTVLDTPGITIREFIGNVASKTSSCSFALATVHRADTAAFQVPRFAEYVIVNSGTLELLTVAADGAGIVKTAVPAGEGVYLPAGLRVKWQWPAPCTYTVVCVPAFSPLTPGSEASATSDTVVDQSSRAALSELHRVAAQASKAPEALPLTLGKEQAAGITPLVVKPVAVVEAPGITITEHFGNVASSDPNASLGRAVVKGPSEEAWQAPLFDEYVVCTSGSIEFDYGEGQRKRIVAGQGVFLPKGLRVKWVWPEATTYSVLCLPAFTPALCGREAEENATNAKDSASMARLEALHKARKLA